MKIGNLKTSHSFNPELNIKIVDEISAKGKGFTEYIRYAAEGEPLLNKNLIEILDYAVKNSGTNVTLTTNGTLIKNEMTEKLLETNLFLIDISIDAYSEAVYEKIRRGGVFEDVIENTRRLLEYKKRNNKSTRLVVSFVSQPSNRHEEKEFEEFWKNEGVDYVVIRRLHSASGSQKEAATELEKDEMERKPCLYPWERLLINHNGAIYFCPNDWTNASKLGNIANESIFSVWNGKEIEKVRTAHLTNNFCEFPLCRECPDWRQTRWPHEGRSYANMINDFKEEQ